MNVLYTKKYKERVAQVGQVERLLEGKADLRVIGEE